MFTAALATLLTLVHSVVCQFGAVPDSDSTNSNESGFEPDAVISGTLAVGCLFTFSFFVLTVWCFIALIQGRGHRSPYVFLCLALILSVLENAFFVPVELVYNASWVVPIQLTQALDGVQWLFCNWSNLFLYLSLVAVLWNRETVIHTASEGKAGQHNRVFMAVHAVLAVLIFGFGTAGPAVWVAAFRQSYYLSDNSHLLAISNDLGIYSFGSFIILAGIVVSMSTFLLWRASRAAGITDKITNIMFCVIAPLYTAYNLLNIIFMVLTALFSGMAYARAVLAANLLVLLSYFAVAFVLLFLSVNRENWKVPGSTVLPTHTPTPDWAQHTELQQHEQPHNAQPMHQPDNYLLPTSPSSVGLGSSFVGEQSRPYPALPYATARQSVTTTAPTIGTSAKRTHEQMHSVFDGRGSVLNPRLMDEHVSLAPTGLELPVALANRLSPLTTSISHNEIVADKELPVVSAPFPPSSSVAYSNNISLVQPTHEPTRAANASKNLPNAQLTDEQIDFVSRLSSADVPATDIARLMQRMRAGGAGSGQGSGSGEMHGGMGAGAAPPSYDAMEA